MLYGQNEIAYQLSTHVLDIQEGKPAENIMITLYKQDDRSLQFDSIASGRTDTNGRIADFLPQGKNNEGVYKLKFYTFPYFNNRSIQSIYPFIEVVFHLEGEGHYHIPITVSANGYATYKGN